MKKNNTKSKPSRSPKLPRVQIHKDTIKYLLKGHPWVTSDSFSNKFPAGNAFLVGTDKNKKEFALFLHDPSHPQVKARLWSRKEPFQEEFQNFRSHLKLRIEQSLLYRKKLGVLEKRDNAYLVFGEADFLPGIHVLIFKDVLYIQVYSKFWEKYLDTIMTLLQNILKEHFGLAVKGIWTQQRDSKKKAPPKFHSSTGLKRAYSNNLVIEEFGVKYKLKMGEYYDVGIYTDMSSIREALVPYFERSNSLLNLYAYTGAFSLLAMKLGLETTNVDVSAPYLEWLSDNAKENGFTQFSNMEDSTDGALDKLINQEKSFDFIVCDPPSFSSDKSKSANAFQQYPALIKKLKEVVNENGYILLFLNTHSVSKKQFLDMVKKNFDNKRFSIESEFSLGNDAKTLKSFPEGNYLKGILVKKTQN